MFGGVGLGNANIVRAVSVHNSWPQRGRPGRARRHDRTLAADITQQNHLLYGYSAGVGVDVMLMAGLFLRAEWEYRAFTRSDRYQHQYGARRRRLQVLIENAVKFSFHPA